MPPIVKEWVWDYTPNQGLAKEKLCGWYNSDHWIVPSGMVHASPVSGLQLEFLKSVLNGMELLNTTPKFPKSNP